MANFGILLSVKHKVTSLERNAAKKGNSTKSKPMTRQEPALPILCQHCRCKKNANARFMFKNPDKKVKGGVKTFN